MKRPLQVLRDELRNTFVNPTPRQKEAYGRFCHTLSATAIAGMFALVHVGQIPNGSVVWQALSLAIGASVLFVVGAILSKGE
jgi:hypothetical protein